MATALATAAVKPIASALLCADCLSLRTQHNGSPMIARPSGVVARIDQRKEALAARAALVFALELGV